MKAGMNVDTTNDNGETMLFVAVATGHVDGMWALVKAGANHQNFPHVRMFEVRTV
jgi:hypothetical protein